MKTEEHHQQELEHQEEKEMNIEKEISFARQVWETLSQLNVNDITEKKGNLTYLSWANAWSLLMEKYPNSNYLRCDDEYFADGTMSVSMKIIVSDGVNVLEREMYLQVLNYKNQPVANPSSHDINNTRMRCLTKAIAMCGLGCYIYAGHDLPTNELVEVEVREKQPRKPHDDMLLELKKKMDESTNIGQLRMHSEGAYKYFKQWKSQEHADQITEHFKSLEKTFQLDQAS